jgi:anaerobic dimethyl sulfoxide reductase subunit B (iron-sulfur subunit)
MGACPTQAISKRAEDGIVIVHENLCIGCHACATVCPFGAPQFPDGTRMSKCDFCVARVENGLEPACVRTCPTRALAFGPMEKLAEQQAKKASGIIVSSIRSGLVVVPPAAMKG